MEKINYKFIHEKTKISIGTISRYFNNGPVSKKNKQILDNIVKKYNYAPNQHASNIKKQSNTIVVLISNKNSYSNHQILDKIVELHSDVMCIYYKDDFETFKEKFVQARSLNSKGIIIFPPSNTFTKLEKYLPQFSNTENIALYDYTIDKIKCVSYNLEPAIMQMIEQNKEITINYFYENKNDHIFKSLTEKIFPKFKKVSLINIEKQQNIEPNALNWYQYNSLISRIDSNQPNIISSKNYNYQYQPKYWIKIDFEQIGIELYNQIMNNNQKQQVLVSCKLKIMN